MATVQPLDDADLADGTTVEWRMPNHEALPRAVKVALATWQSNDQGMATAQRTPHEAHPDYVDAVRTVNAFFDTPDVPMLPAGAVVWHNPLIIENPRDIKNEGPAAQRIADYAAEKAADPVWFPTSSSARKAALFKAAGTRPHTIHLMRIRVLNATKALPVEHVGMSDSDNTDRSMYDEDEILFAAGRNLEPTPGAAPEEYTLQRGNGCTHLVVVHSFDMVDE